MYRAHVAAAVLVAATYGASAGLVLWSGTPDKVPPYLSGANVSMAVEQEGDYRSFIWTADWLDKAVSGEMNMGRMHCPLSQTAQSRLAALPLQERGRLHLPCDFGGPDQLVAGSDIVQQIVSSVVALRAKKVAMVGLGPGTQATYWQRFHPEIERIDVAELSGTVVDVAKQYFGLQPDRRLKIHVADGMQWLKEAEPFDVFVHDATGSEHYFLWPSVLRLIQEKSNGGAMVINILGTPALVKALLLAYLRIHFAEVRTYSNVVIASWTPLVMNWDGLPDHIKAWQEQGVGESYSSYYHWVLAISFLVVLAGVARMMNVKASLPSQLARMLAKKEPPSELEFDEEIVPLTKLHPRAGFHYRPSFKERDLEALDDRSKLDYGVF